MQDRYRNHVSHARLGTGDPMITLVTKEPCKHADFDDWSKYNQ